MNPRTTLAALGLATLALGAAALPARAAPTVVAKGLDNPRGLALAADGTLYVAEAGRSGRTCVTKDTCLGYTSRIAKVAPDGALSTVLGGLISGGGRDGTFGTGVDDVALGPDGTAYGILTSAPPKVARSLPARARAQIGRVVHAESGRAIFGPRVDTIENTSNPDGTDVNSNPYGLAIAADGTQYVADAGGNTILRIRGGRVTLVGIVPKTGTKAQPVPTSLRIGPDGALYIGVLGGDGTPRNGSKVFRLVPGRRPTVYAKGLSNITGIAFDKAGSLYVTELSRTMTTQGPKGDGDVVKIAANGTKTRIGAGELTFPAGAAVADDGTVYVSNFSILPATTPVKGPFKGAGGQVVKFSQP